MSEGEKPPLCGGRCAEKGAAVVGGLLWLTNAAPDAAAVALL